MLKTDVELEHIQLWCLRLSFGYLKVSSDVECDCGCGVNETEDGEVETEGQHTRTEYNDEGCPRRRVCFKPALNPVAFQQ